ncbi:hypothetical protein LCGC14_3111110, partial [marine sediment metagenome]
PLLSYTVGTFAVGIPMALLGMSYWSLVFMQIAEIATSAITLGIVAWPLLPRLGFSRKAFREMLSLGVGFSLSQFSSFLSKNMDRFLIARILGADALGLYSRAAFLSQNAAALFGNIARITTFPALAKLQGERDRLRNAVLKTISLTALLGIPASVFLIIFAPEIVDVLLGAKWQAATLPLACLSAGLYFQLGRRTNNAGLQAIGHPYRILVGQVIAILVILGGVPVASPHGLYAVVLVVIAGFAASFAFSLWQVCRLARLTPLALFASYTIPLGLGVMIGVLGVLVKIVLADWPSLLRLLVLLLRVVVLLCPSVTSPFWVF